MAESLEASDYTSIQDRIRRVQRQYNDELPELMQFSEEQRDSGPVFLPFGLKSYLELVDWSGRAKRADKRGHIEAKLAPPHI